MPLLKELFNAFPGTPVNEGTFKAFVKGMAGYKIETVTWAMEEYVREETRFPTVAAVRKIAQRRARDNLAGENVADVDHQLEDKEQVKRKRYYGASDDKSERYRLLGKYPSVLARHKEQDNW